MKIWKSGRESALLDDVIAGRKTIEGRLNRGKFAEYSVGDAISLRRDYRDEAGVLHDGEPDAALHNSIAAVRRGGTISVVGVYAGKADPMPIDTMFDKQVTMRMGQANVKRWIDGV